MTPQTFIQALQTYPQLSAAMREELAARAGVLSDEQKAMVLDHLEEATEELEMDLDGSVRDLLQREGMSGSEASGS